MGQMRSKSVLFALLLGLAPIPVLAQVGSTVPNWTVPPYTALRAEGGLTTMTDISPGIGFVAMQPCRVFDTRNSNGPYGGPRLVANATRTFDIDNGPCGPIPAEAEAYSMNFGAILPDGANSFITIWPTGAAQPLVSAINPVQGAVVANAAIVPAGAGGSISVFANTGVHLYGDINGYFTDAYNPGVRFTAEISGGGAAIQGRNLSGAFGSFGVEGSISTTGAGSGSAGIRGINDGTGSGGVGIWGSQAGSGWGVYGETPTGFGVHGEVKSTTPPNGSAGVRGTNNGTGAAGVGVWGLQNGSGWGVYGSTPAGVGVYGEALNASGAIAGVRGVTGSQSNGAAGVRGQDGGGTVPLSWPGTSESAGVRGESHNNVGVLGLSDTNVGQGVCGINVGGTRACLGYTSTIGLDVLGNSQVSGSKSFVEPHPTDASKLIRYISLEGNESGTYFRGRGKFQNGIAVIEVPEDFRIVTDPEGLSIQVTPIAQMATVAVESIGLDRIVVRGSRNVEFFYLVNGVRHAFRDARAIAPNEKTFVPTSPDDQLLLSLPQVLRQRLISNGTYNADGTVNLETARRFGWDKVWEERSRPAPRPVEP